MEGGGAVILTYSLPGNIFGDGSLYAGAAAGDAECNRPKEVIDKYMR